MTLSAEEQNLIWFPIVSQPGTKIYDDHWQAGKFFNVISSFLSKTFHQEKVFLSNAFDAANFCEYFESSFNQFLTLICSDYNLSEYDILIFGVSCLFCFIQYNLTGPAETTEDSALAILLKYNTTNMTDIFREIEKNVIVHLSSNDDFISCITREPILLFLSKLVFRWCPTSGTKDWWMLRSLYIHQLLLSDPSPSIYNEIIEITNKLDLQISTIGDSKLNALYTLEKIQIHLHLYSEVSKSKSLIVNIFNDLQLEANLIGKLGKRTKFQERDIAQLTLNVDTGDDQCAKNSCISCSSFPKDQKLDDEIRLPIIEFTGDRRNIFVDEIQQAAILALFVLTKKSQPKDTLQVEELSPFITYLLSEPKIWSFQLSALLFRSLLESESSRTVERSITQLQSLITDWESASPSAIERLPLIFCSFTPPKWKLERDLARLLVEIGAIKSALDIYEHLKMWEEIVACYNTLKLKQKAAEVIRREMAKQETVQLLYLLGDATGEKRHYEKAWKLSNFKSSKVQKHWALHYFSRKNYKKSIPHLQKSLKLNSLQVPLWFDLGFAAMDQKKWKLSITAYKRYCSLEPDNFEAWSNQARAYYMQSMLEKKKEKKKKMIYQARRALQEAVKCDHNNWKPWDNLMIMSTWDDLEDRTTVYSDFHEVIRCYHRILDIKEKHTDLEVLDTLVNALVPNSANSDIPTLIEQAIKLFGRLTSSVRNNAVLWILYATLTDASKLENAEKHQKVAHYLQNAQRIMVNVAGWEQYVDGCKDMIKLCLKLADAQKQCTRSVSDQQAVQHLNSAKLIMNDAVARIRRWQSDVSGVLNADLIQPVQDLSDEISDVKNLLQRYTRR